MSGCKITLEITEGQLQTLRDFEELHKLVKERLFCIIPSSFPASADEHIAALDEFIHDLKLEWKRWVVSGFNASLKETDVLKDMGLHDSMGYLC